MTLSTKLFLLTFLLVAFVLVVLYLRNQSLFKTSMTSVGQGRVPTTTPIQSNNPLGFPVDPDTGTVILPTGNQFSPFGVPGTSGAGRLSAPTACGQLQKILTCYLEKAPKLAVGYETYAKGDLYADMPPAVQSTKCSETISTLAETTRKESIKAGCIW